jgi:hypothetical protein
LFKQVFAQHGPLGNLGDVAGLRNLNRETVTPVEVQID